MRTAQPKASNFSKERQILSWLSICLGLLLANCQDNSFPVPIKAEQTPPTYSNVQLVAQPDTLDFVLSQNIYNEIKSFNYFTDHHTPFLSFYDRKSESIALYDFQSRHPIKIIQLKKIFKKKNLFKASVYTQNFDSILVTEYTDLCWLDSSGVIKKKVPFVEEKESFAYFDTPVPVVASNGLVFLGIRPWISEKSLKGIRKWKILYAFDLQHKTRELLYSLPTLYRNGLYGKRFMEYSYCYNDKGNFVFSFPADTLIYETNLKDYHVAYYAKSRFQQGSIEPVSKEALERDEGRKEATLRDCYGPIYFDPHTKRYFRFIKHKVSKEAYESKNYERRVTVIVFNQDFKIIGEFEFKKNYHYDTIFFTEDGGIYARVNPKDENALHFVRLAWSEDSKDSMPLTKK